MIQAYPFKSAEILDLIFKTKLKGFPCNFVLIFFKKLKGLQVTGDPFNFKTPLHKNPCKTPAVNCLYLANICCVVLYI